MGDIIAGWQEGDYALGNFKAAIDKLIREMQARFLGECRNFCMGVCLRAEKKVENPSIKNLLQMMTIAFCGKTFTYFSDLFRNLMVRTFSVCHKGMEVVLR